MKKTCLTIAALALSATVVFSQEKLVKKGEFKDNWFIQAQGGASLTVSEHFKDASIFSDLVTPHVALSVGKYFSPSAGVRLQGAGWESKNYLSYNDKTFKVKYIQANADALLNLGNLFGTYNPDRTFNFIGIAGLGYVHGFKKSNAFVDKAGESQKLATTNSIVPRLGFQLDFRTSDAISLNLEAVGNLMNDDFNGIKEGTKYDGTVNVLAGVTFHLGKSNFDVVNYIDQSVVDNLNGQLNAQRSQLNDKDSQLSAKSRQIADLEAALAQKPTVVTETQTETELVEETVMNAVVVFKIGKADLQDNQEINIYNAAKFFQNHPNTDVIVTGYADKSTGTAAFNQKISEKRAEAVAKILINKYGIAPSRVTTKASGDTEQPFKTDEWNRVVIFTAVKKVNQ